MKKTIGIGVIGLNMGVCLFPLNKDSNSKFEVRAVCSARDAKKASILLKDWRINFFTNNYNELINRDDIDVVVIFSPDSEHFLHASAAAKAGKHVVITKPFANSVEEAIELYSIANKTKIKLLVGQTMRFEPQFQDLFNLYSNGKIGKLITVESHYIHDMREMYKKTPWRLQKEWLIGAGNHPIDAVRWLIGKIEEVHAYASKGGISEYKDLDNYIINIKGEKGVLARILLLMGCAESPEPMMKIGIFGSEGSGFASHTDNKGGILKYRIDDYENGSFQHKNYNPEKGLDPYGHMNTILRYMRYFEKCLLDNLPVYPSAEDGAKSILTAECIRRSIEENRPVKMEELPLP